MNITDVLQVQIGDQVIFSENNFYSVLRDVYTVMDVQRLSNGHKIALIVNDYSRGWFNCNKLMVVVRHCNNVHEVEFPFNDLNDLTYKDVQDLYNPYIYNTEIDIKRSLVRDLVGKIRRSLDNE